MKTATRAPERRVGLEARPAHENLEGTARGTARKNTRSIAVRLAVPTAAILLEVALVVTLGGTVAAGSVLLALALGALILYGHGRRRQARRMAAAYRRRVHAVRVSLDADTRPALLSTSGHGVSRPSVVGRARRAERW